MSRSRWSGNSLSYGSNELEAITIKHLAPAVDFMSPEALAAMDYCMQDSAGQLTMI